MAQHVHTNENGDKRSFKRTTLERGEFTLPPVVVTKATEFRCTRKEIDFAHCMELANHDVKKATYIYNVYYR